MSAVAALPPRTDRLAPRHWVEILCLFVALAVHVPFIPTPLKSFIESLFEEPDEELSHLDVEVPIELDLDSAAINQKDAVPPPPPPPPTNEAPPEPVDAGPPKDASPPDAGAPDAPPPDAPPPDAAPPPDLNPITSVGIPANPSGNINNVQIVLVGKVLRSHPVGEKMGALLPQIRQWRDFFDGTGIDAVRDADLMVLMGPQMRRSEQVDAVIVFNTPMDQVKVAVDKVVDRSKGTWLEGDEHPTAIGKADQHERMFVLVPDKHTLYITPPPHPKLGQKWTDDETLAERKKKVDHILKFAASAATKVDQPFAINIAVSEPGKLSVVKVPIIGKMQLVPSTVQKLVFIVFPLPNGEASLRIELYEDTAANASTDLAEVQSNWGLAQLGAHAALDLDVPDATFTTKGRLISADVKVSQAFLDQVFELGQKQINKENK